MIIARFRFCKVKLTIYQLEFNKTTILSNLICSISIASNLRKNAFWTHCQILGIIKAIVRGRKIGQEPSRNIDIVKAMTEMILSRDMSSNQHETNSTKQHIDKSQEVSSIIVLLNRKTTR